MRRLAVAALIGLVLASASTPVSAQGQYLQVEGWVQWVSAQRLQLVLDNGLSISVDLTRMPQDQYQGLNARDRVSVVGVVSSDNRRLVAASVSRVETWGSQAP